MAVLVQISIWVGKMTIEPEYSARYLMLQCRRFIGRGMPAHLCRVRGYLILALTLFPLFFLLVSCAPIVDAVTSGHKSFTLGTVILIVLSTLATVCLALMGFSALLQAKRVDVAQLRIMHGYCFETLTARPFLWRQRQEQAILLPSAPDEAATQESRAEPEVLFARIGENLGTARWYVFSGEWRHQVEDPTARVEMEVLPGTDWVARLNALDDYAGLDWLDAQFPGEDCRLPLAERKLARQAFWKARMGWGGSLHLTSIEGLLRLVSVMTGFVILVPLEAQLLNSSSLDVVLGIYLLLLWAVIAIILLRAAIGFIYRALRMWLSNDTHRKMTVVGTVIRAWSDVRLPYWTERTSRIFVEIRDSNHKNWIFAIHANLVATLPSAWLQQDIAITYLSPNEEVLDVRVVDAPAI